MSLGRSLCNGHNLRVAMFGTDSHSAVLSTRPVNTTPIKRAAAALGLVLVAGLAAGQSAAASWSASAPAPSGGVSEITPYRTLPTKGREMPAAVSARVRENISPAVVSADWSTYHHDNARSGYDAAQPAFNGVKTGWASPTTVDADVYAEPLVVGNTVVIATENNTVYGLSAATGAILWQRNLGTPVTSGLPCGNVNPAGITGTPVIDTNAGLIYAVGLLQGPPIHYLLAAIHLSDGTIAWSRTITITGFDATIEGQRGALTLLNGTLYIPFGGRYGDCGNYHGYLLATPATSSGAITFFQASTDNGAGFWQAAGASVDASGNLYETSGNSYDTGTYDGGETVFKLSPSLIQLSYFAPSNWQALNATDTDLGSVGPLPVGNNIFQVGKSGEGYFLNQANLGGIGGQLFSGPVCSQTTDAAFGGAAYVAPYIIVPCSTGPVGLTVTSGSCARFAVAWTGPATSFATPPIVAAGLVWIIDPGGTFYGLNPTSGATVFSQNIGSAVHFATPASGDGAVFVAASTQVYSFVSANPPGPPPGPYPIPPTSSHWWCQPLVNTPNPRIRTPWWLNT